MLSESAKAYDSSAVVGIFALLSQKRKGKKQACQKNDDIISGMQATFIFHK